MTDSLKAPVATKKPHRIEKHGDVRIDDYFWLREKENPDVIALLNAENAYTQAVLAPHAKLREELFEEMKGRIKEDDAEVPYKDGPYFYYSRMEGGKQYPILCRRKGAQGTEEIVLDCNELAHGQKYFKLGAYEISPDHQLCAYSADYDGSEKFTVRFKNLADGSLFSESISGSYPSLEWANDNRTIFYTMLDEHDRPDRILRHTLGEANDELVYKELDPELFIGVAKTRSERFLFIDISGKTMSETRYLDANTPHGEFKPIAPRRKNVLYSATHHDDKFYIVTNDTIQNFRLVEAPVASPGAENWKEVRSGSATLFIEDVEAFKNHLIVHEREHGLEQLRVIDLKDMSDHRIAFSEPTYSLGGQANAEFNTETYRFSYTSLVTPRTVYDYDLRKRTREVKKTQEIPSGYDPSQYISERLEATAPDGTKVPISLVYKKGITKGPLYLYGYGSYGLSMPAAFGTARLSLIDRGFVFAIAHIRGGSEMGRQWYEDGKFLKKQNTFSDFIACAEHLIKTGYTRAGEIVCVGGSAGGMLIGNVINQRPELFRAAAAHVPFVDVVNTMLDNTLPLTTFEYEEWGNPDDKKYYDSMKSYSPYDNVKAQAYPHLLVTSGLNDPRVTYWEPAKWVAKLRELRSNDNLLLQHIHMGAGHGGPSGRYESLKETAMEYAFFLKTFGKA